MTKPIQIARAYLHTIGGSRSTHNRLGCTMHPRGTSSWEPYTPKSNKLLELKSHVSPWGTQTDETNANGKNTLSGQVLLFEIQPKQIMLGRDLRGRTKEEHKATPRYRYKGFPSLRGDMVWWKCRSRSPLYFPSKWRQESWRDGEEASSKIPP